MPADPLAPVSAGQPVPRSERTWNPILEAARGFRRMKQKGQGTVDPKPERLTPAHIITVRNMTGADLGLFDVVELTDTLESLTDDYLLISDRPALDGDTPTGTDIPFAILLDAIADGELGRAVVGGCAVVDVDIVDSGHEYATPQASTTGNLVSAASGPVRIIDRETGSSGIKRACVLVSQPIGTAIEAGNTATEYTGATTTGPATEIKAVKPIRMKRDATDPTKWSAAIIPPTEDATGYTTFDVVSKVCPIKKWLSVELSGDPLVATPVLNDTEVPRSVEIMTGITVESREIKILGSAGDPACVEDPSDCCGCDCEACDGTTALPPDATTALSLNGVTTGPFTSGVDDSTYYSTVWTKSWTFCVPEGQAFDLGITSIVLVSAPPQNGAEESNSYFASVTKAGGCTGDVTNVDSDGQLKGVEDSWNNLENNIPIQGVACQKVIVEFTLVYRSTTAFGGTPVLTANLTRVML